MITIKARDVKMDGTSIEHVGYMTVKGNRILNVEMGCPPMDKDRTIKDKPIAVVGYGPSLLKTWERLRDFDGPIITVSKAHDFLIERGIIPTFHMDLDMRLHKVEFMTKPDPRVQYFLSTHVHPTYIPKLRAAGIEPKLFHVLINTKERHDPRYPGLKVRFDAGAQAAELVFQRGYRDQHWFGIEYGREGLDTHAGEHWGVKSEHCVVDVDGRLFGSTQMFFHGLLLAEHMLCDRALLKCTIHGGGLLGHFIKARGRVPRVKML